MFENCYINCYICKLLYLQIVIFANYNIEIMYYKYDNVLFLYMFLHKKYLD